MDDICLALFNVLNEETKGGCGVFYEDELLEAIPADLRTRETLEASLKRLHGEGCIEVKYARGEAFCIEVKRQFMPQKAENDADFAPDTPSSSTNKSAYAWVCISAFLGAMLGSGAAVAVAAVILC